MPFGMVHVSGVSRGMGELDGGGVRRRGRGSFRGELGCPVVTNGDFATRLFPNYFGQDLLDFSLLLSVSCQVHGRPRLS